MVHLLLVYYSTRWTDHPDLVTGRKMVPDDDGSIRDWIRRGGVFTPRSHVSG
jgi:hypothetical protein